MTRLRTAKGFSLSYISSQFGNLFHDYAFRMANLYLKKGLLEFNGDNIKLSHQGIFISDGIMSDLMYIQD